MTTFGHELLTVDREHLDLRAGLLGLVVLAVFGVAIALVGPVAMAAAIGALVVLSTNPPPAGRSWVTALLPLVVGGALLTFIAVWTGDQAAPAALLVGVVGIVASLHGGRSRKAGIRGLIATLWIILALTLYDTGSVVTLATVGFGDLHPTTDLAKLFTCSTSWSASGSSRHSSASSRKHRASAIARLRTHEDTSDPDAGRGWRGATSPRPAATDEDPT
jgi:hypothetical protein